MQLDLTRIAKIAAEEPERIGPSTRPPLKPQPTTPQKQPTTQRSPSTAKPAPKEEDKISYQELGSHATHVVDFLGGGKKIKVHEREGGDLRGDWKTAEEFTGGSADTSAVAFTRFLKMNPNLKLKGVQKTEGPYDLRLYLGK